jgi:hypothetical protein
MTGRPNRAEVESMCARSTITTKGCFINWFNTQNDFYFQGGSGFFVLNRARIEQKSAAILPTGDPK